MNIRRGIPGAIAMTLIGIKVTTENPSLFDFWTIPVLQTNVGAITKVIYTLLTSFTTFLIFAGLGITIFLRFIDNMDLEKAIQYVMFFGFYGIIIGLFINLAGYNVPIISDFAKGEDAIAAYLIGFVLLSLIPGINCIVFMLVGISLAWYFGSIVFFKIDAQRTIHPFLFTVPLFFALGYFLHLQISKSRIGRFYTHNVWGKYKHTIPSKVMLAMLFFTFVFSALCISKRVQLDLEWALVAATLLWFPGSVVLIKLITRKHESVKEKIKLQQRLNEKREQLNDVKEKIREREYQLELIDKNANKKSDVDKRISEIISVDPANLSVQLTIIEKLIRNMPKDQLETRERELNSQLRDLGRNLKNTELKIKQLNNDLADLELKEIEKQQLLEQKIEKGDAANLRVLADTLFDEYGGMDVFELEELEPENEIGQIIKEICITRATINKTKDNIQKLKTNASDMQISGRRIELEKFVIQREKINAGLVNIDHLKKDLEKIRHEEWKLMMEIGDLENQLQSKSKPTLKISKALPVSLTIVTSVLAILYLI